MTTQPATTPANTTTPATAKFQQLRSALRSAFIGRDAEIDAMLVATLAREHCLLLGPPGTGKSALTSAFASAMPGRYFQRLLTKFSAPEDVFGPVSVTGLKNDKFERQIDGFLPTASVAFLDEIFKANAAILNALLTALNERAYDQGPTRMKIPLEVVIGASNELPEDDEALGALYDRFMTRRWVDYVESRDERRALIRMTGAPAVAVRLSEQDIADARAFARSVALPDDVVDGLLDIRDALAREAGVVMSDRRLRKCAALVQAHAALHGRSTATRGDLMVVADSAWRTPDERGPVRSVVAGIAAPDRAEAERILDAATELMASVDLDNLDARSLGEVSELKCELDKIVARLQALTDVDDVMNRVVGYKKRVARVVRDLLA